MKALKVSTSNASYEELKRIAELRKDVVFISLREDDIVGLKQERGGGLQTSRGILRSKNRQPWGLSDDLMSLVEA